MCRKNSAIQQFFLHEKQEKSLVQGKILCYIEKSGTKLIKQIKEIPFLCDLINE